MLTKEIYVSEMFDALNASLKILILLVAAVDNFCKSIGCLLCLFTVVGVFIVAVGCYVCYCLVELFFFTAVKGLLYI